MLQPARLLEQGEQGMPRDEEEARLKLLAEKDYNAKNAANTEASYDPGPKRWIDGGNAPVSAFGIAAAPPPQFDLDHLFTYHSPDLAQMGQYSIIRNTAKFFAQVILDTTPPGADQSAAIRHIRDAVMTANAAIALRGRT
jgi:hypothetical protein